MGSSKELIDYETCVELENKDLSYKEMIDVLGMKLTPQHMCRTFKKYGIKHKTKKERLRTKILNDKGSYRYLARKYKCSTDLIWEIFKEDKH